jgi:Zn-dependent protease
MDINHEIIKFLLVTPPFLFALTFHELAHGWVAWRLGDPTAKDAGRLTMNPIKHIDPLGAIAFIIMRIGWAKPVPVNPAYFRNPHQGMLQVALAGPVANLLLALVSAVLFNPLNTLSHSLSSPLLLALLEPTVAMLGFSVWINIMLAVFNLLPIPPLDGSKVLMGLLPPDAARSYAQMEPYGFILLLVLFYMGLINKVILPVIDFGTSLLLR